MWTVVKIIAAISATLLTLMFIAILVMVTRPTVLTGVSGGQLAHSISGGDDSGVGGWCNKRPDGDWKCSVYGPDANGTFRVDVNWMGCWTANPAGPDAASGQSHKGCIELGDIITLD